MSQIPPPNPPQRPQPPIKPHYDEGAAAAKTAAAAGGGVLIVIFVIAGFFAVMSLCVIGVLVALLLPAVNAAREAAQRAQSVNNVRQLCLAMLNYETTHQQFPTQYTVDESRQPLLSWRAQLLPFIEQMAAFNQLNQNEAWDSPMNAGVTDIAIPTFLSPRYGQSGNVTNYVAIAGDGFVFNGTEQQRIATLRDGSTNTIFFVEIANSDIAWAEPRDLTMNDLKFEELGAPADTPNLIRRGAVIGFADGHVITMQTADPEELRKMLTFDGNEPVNAW